MRLHSRAQLFGCMEILCAGLCLADYNDIFQRDSRGRDNIEEVNGKYWEIVTGVTGGILANVFGEWINKDLYYYYLNNNELQQYLDFTFEYSFDDGDIWDIPEGLNISVVGPLSQGYHSIVRNDNLVRVRSPYSIGFQAFCDYQSLQTVELTHGGRIGAHAFARCSNLRSVLGSIELVDIGAFYECCNLDSISLDHCSYIGAEAFHGCSQLKSISFSDNLRYIGYWAFSECPLTSVVIPDSVETIGAGAFCRCDKLKDVVLGGNIRRFGSDDAGGGAFQECGSLERITIPDSVENIGEGTFSGCTNLTQVTIGRGVSEMGDVAFGGCSALTNVTFWGNAPTVVSEIAFYGVSPNCVVYVMPNSTGWGVDIPGVWKGVRIEMLDSSIIDVPLIITDVSCDYCCGDYGKGSKGTFLTGVDCDISFNVDIETKEGVVVDYLLINGERYDSIDSFTFNVGSLSPGDKLEVVAVDTHGGESEPFRVNLDIADYPPLWSSITRILPERHPEEGRILYTTAEISMLSFFDTIEDGFDIIGHEFPLALKPAIKIAQTFESDTAQFHSGSDMGGIGSENRQSLGTFSILEIGAYFSNDKVRQWQPDSQTWEDVGNDLGVKISGKAKTPKFRPAVFPLAYAEIALSTDLDFTVQEEEGQYSCEIEGDPFISVRGEIGCGVDGLLKGAGYIQGGVRCDAVAPGNPNHIQRLGIQAKAALTGVIVGFEHNLFPPWEKTYWLIGGSRARLMASAGAQTLDLDDSGWALLSRDYVKAPHSGGGNKRLLASSMSSSSESLGDGYPYPSPVLATACIEDVLLYLRDDIARTAVNRTELVCRAGVSNEWSCAESVWSDGTPDFMPNVAANASGTVVAAWANANRELADDATLSDMCRSLEIAVGVMDSASGAWTCENLTDDDALDMNPKVRVAADGSAVVAWVRNVSGEFLGSIEKPSSIMIATYRNGAWSSPVIVAENVGMVYSFDVAYDGNTASIVYAKDGDGDIMTADPREVWGVAVSAGMVAQASRLSSESNDSLRPFAWYDSEGSLRFIWLEDENLVAGSKFGAVEMVASDCDIPPDFSFLPMANGSAMLVWQRLADTEAGSETVCAAYDPVVGRIGEPFVLFHSRSSKERGVTGVVGGDDALRMAYESVSVTTNASGVVENGAVELKTFWCCRGADVGFGADAFSIDGDIVAGETTDVLVKVTNFGADVAEGNTVHVWFGEGEERMLLGTVVVDVPPLSTVAVSVPWSVPEVLSGVVFTAEACGSGHDGNSLNNMISWRPDSMVSIADGRSIEGEGASMMISAAIRNNGHLWAPLDDGAEVRLWRGDVGGQLLDVKTVGEAILVADGEFETALEWDMSAVPMTSTVERVVVELAIGSSHPTLSVDVVGATVTLHSADDAVVVSETTLRVPRGAAIGDLPMPTSEEGYTFKGWFTWPDGGEEVLPSMIVYHDFELFAHWEAVPVPEFTIVDGELKEVALNGQTKISLPDGVTSIAADAFIGCDDLESVAIPASVTNICGSAFAGCAGIKEVECFPDVLMPVETRKVSVDYGADWVDQTEFDGSYWYEGGSADVAVASLKINVTGSGVLTFDFNAQESFDTYYDMYDRKVSVYVDGVKTQEFDWSNWQWGWTSAQVNLGDGEHLVRLELEYIGGYNFWVRRIRCSSTLQGKSLAQIFPDSCIETLIVSNGAKKMPYGFCQDSSSLRRVDLPSGLVEISADAFAGCYGIEDVAIPRAVLENGMSSVFKEQDVIIRNVVLRDDVTVLPSNCFAGRYYLRSVELPNGLVEIGDNAFGGCSCLENMAIPGSVKRIGHMAFCYCTSLSAVLFKGDAPSVAEDAFVSVNYGCVGLVPRGSNGWHVNEGMIWKGGLSLLYEDNLNPVDDGGPVVEWHIENGILVGVNLDGAAHAVIPDDVMSIGAYAFMNCGGLVCVTIPSSVTNIGEFAFMSCYNLATVYVPAALDFDETIAFVGCAPNIEFIFTCGDSVPRVLDDLGAIVDGDPENGFTIKPGDNNKDVVITIPDGVAPEKVTVEVTADVETVKANGAKVKVMNEGHDIAAFLDLAAVTSAGGVINLAEAKVKDDVAKEALDTASGADIKLSPTDPSITTANTRPGLKYTFVEGRTIEELAPTEQYKWGDNTPFKPTPSIKGGTSGFYTIKVEK